VREVGQVADGVIVGSALVRHLEAAASNQKQEALAEISRHVGELVAAGRAAGT
jgi:tryptophan synthase alpha subunit